MMQGVLSFGLSSVEAWLVALIAFSLAGLGFVAWRSPPAKMPTPAASPTPREGFAATALQLDSEAAAILKLVRSHLEAGDRYSVSLAQADKDLPSLATRDEIGIIVKFLIAENAKMQYEARDLKTSLEQSKSQIEKLRSHLAEAQEMGMRDPLTALSNRRGFDLSLAGALADAQARGTPLCLVMGDIDNFKKVNDAFGHPVGDEILKLFAQVLTKSVRASDTVARYGGEEFAIILPDTRIEDAERLTERMRSQLETKQLAVNGSGQEIGQITASFGIAELGPDDDLERLIQRADAKLYEAKCAGRNCIVADHRMIAA